MINLCDEQNGLGVIILDVSRELIINYYLYLFCVRISNAFLFNLNC